MEMSFVQIIYEDEDPNGSEEGSNLTPMLLDNAHVIGVKKIEEELSNSNSCNVSADDIEVLSYDTIEDNIKNTGIEWDNRETNYLLKKYNKYILSTGPRKKFRTKKDMWRRISQDMKNDMNIHRSAFQCENRYKTVLRKWRRNTVKEINQDERIVSPVINNHSDSKVTILPSNVCTHKQMHTDKSTDDNSEQSTQDDKRQKSLNEVLWEIFKKKEEGRERRHKEKMQLIQRLMNMNQ